MRIVENRKLEDCFDGSTVYGYSFDIPWDREKIQDLSVLGKLEYFPDFPRPFFRLCGTRGLQIKGVEGESKCRIIYPRKGKEELKRDFESLFDEETDSS
jgi:hypothetical protein